jgi:hypothetical protein
MLFGSRIEHQNRFFFASKVWPKTGTASIMGLYLELGFSGCLLTPFWGIDLAPKVKLVTSILLASVMKFFKEFKNLLLVYVWWFLEI